jgi:recombination protein U
MMKNRMMANKGAAFEQEVIYANYSYKNKGIASVQKISTPWNIVREGNRIITAYPEGKSTLDFKGTVKGGIPISFDCKESQDERGLPLAHIPSHQIDHIREVLPLGEVSFILCHMKRLDKRFFIPGIRVLEYWDYWQANKGKRNVNYISVSDMREVKQRNGIVLDYLEGMYQ